MTAKKDFKRRVRERQDKTGESYTTAREKLLAERAQPVTADSERPFTVVELVDVSTEAGDVGLKCQILATPAIVQQLSTPHVLTRLRDALLATEGDPQLQRMRDVILRGLVGHMVSHRERGWLEDTRRFIARARAGIGGTNREGDMLAFHVDGVLVLVHLGYVPHMPWIKRAQQRVFLSTIDEHRVGQSSALPL